MKFRPLPRGVSVQKLALPLLLPSLLSSCTGFQSRSVAPETPALVFVDGQISESASVITQTQRRVVPPVASPALTRQTPAVSSLAQTAPLPKPVLQAASPRPNTAAVSTGRAPAPSPNLALPALSFTGTPPSIAVLSLSPARNLTLEQWVRRIIPSGWTLNYENALRPALNTRIVSVDTNDQWTRVLNRLLSEQSIQARVDWNSHAVTLQRAGQPAVITAPVAIKTPSTVTPAGTPKNPFSNSETVHPAAVQNIKTVVTPAAIKPAAIADPKPQTVTGQPITPVVQGKSWLAPSGTTVREMLMKWAGETRCESGASTHWTVIWPVSVTDYRLDAPLTFRGSFETMLGQMFELYRTAQKPLYAEASRMQCVISVSDTPAGR